MRQRSIELMNDEHVSALETLTPNNNHNVPAARVKPIMNPLTVAVIPGSMSLLQLRPARRPSSMLSLPRWPRPLIVSC